MNIYKQRAMKRLFGDSKFNDVSGEEYSQRMLSVANKKLNRAKDLIKKQFKELGLNAPQTIRQAYQTMSNPELKKRNQDLFRICYFAFELEGAIGNVMSGLDEYEKISSRRNLLKSLPKDKDFMNRYRNEYSNAEKKALRNELMTIKKKESEAGARLKQITNPLKASIERLKV